MASTQSTKPCEQMAASELDLHIECNYDFMLSCLAHTNSQSQSPHDNSRLATHTSKGDLHPTEPDALYEHRLQRQKAGQSGGIFRVISNSDSLPYVEYASQPFRSASPNKGHRENKALSQTVLKGNKVSVLQHNESTVEDKKLYSLASSTAYGEHDPHTSLDFESSGLRSTSRVPLFTPDYKGFLPLEQAQHQVSSPSSKLSLLGRPQPAIISTPRYPHNNTDHRYLQPAQPAFSDKRFKAMSDQLRANIAGFKHHVRAALSNMKRTDNLIRINKPSRSPYASMIEENNRLNSGSKAMLRDRNVKRLRIDIDKANSVIHTTGDLEVRTTAQTEVINTNGANYVKCGCIARYSVARFPLTWQTAFASGYHEEMYHPTAHTNILHPLPGGLPSIDSRLPDDISTSFQQGYDEKSNDVENNRCEEASTGTPVRGARRHRMAQFPRAVELALQSTFSMQKNEPIKSMKSVSNENHATASEIEYAVESLSEASRFGHFLPEVTYRSEHDELPIDIGAFHQIPTLQSPMSSSNTSSDTDQQLTEFDAKTIQFLQKLDTWQKSTDTDYSEEQGPSVMGTAVLDDPFANHD